ncbi:hypothetical protein GCM10022408_04250 [Hymenobacter fastidiosus]|uniref:Uncharacterized protein n=1 Tax=Hymenobacter fastidiosus TaxID=486264 RepID=A0ABP7RFL4_9BACT
MSRTDTILQEIASLTPHELELVYQEILKRRSNRVAEVLDRHRGKGQGVWTTDAQQYVNQLRADDRE